VIITADNDFLSLADTLGHPPKVTLLDNCDYPTNVSAQRRTASCSLVAMHAPC
jgi:predicted nuclease of predicted toxin-antitoxin system